MSDIVISVENVSKYYRLGLIGEGTLRADCERWWARVLAEFRVGMADH
jgi:lipopolysaccharide transport system ATP-binding protein